MSGGWEMPARDRILNEIDAERVRQDKKWSFPQQRSLAEWMLILAEEVGEVATEINESHFRGRETSNLKTELVQVAAVCVSILEHMELEGK
jgi:NTP pyrophosphatase (non-canonical NTP hydrolase)